MRLCEKSLHDAIVKSYEILANDIFILTMDCSDALNYTRDLKLKFTGVRNLTFPKDFNGAWWLYEEIYLTSIGFQFNVLFSDPLFEFSISANDVSIEIL